MSSERMSALFKDLPLANNFMFAQVMRQADICKLFLEALLQKPIARIEYIDTEKDLSDELGSHGIRLDVYLRDEKNSVYNIEMQATNPQKYGDVYSYDLEKRVRYYQSSLDRSTLPKGEPYSQLSDCYIIFVCDFDYYGYGLALYEKYSGMKGCDAEYIDGSHVFFLNAEYTVENAEPPILEFLHCVHSNDISRVYSSELMQKVCPAMKEVRNDPKKEVAYMTWKMSQDDARREGKYEGMLEGRREGMLEGRREGMLEGEAETRRKTVLNMREKGLTDKEITDFTGYPPEVVASVPREDK